jgi:hypothetical protein
MTLANSTAPEIICKHSSHRKNRFDTIWMEVHSWNSNTLYVSGFSDRTTYSFSRDVHHRVIDNKLLIIEVALPSRMVYCQLVMLSTKSISFHAQDSPKTILYVECELKTAVRILPSPVTQSLQNAVIWPI